MDNAQFNLKNAGRFDLGGINHGAGYDPKAGTDKAGLYQLANGKKESIEAMVDSAGIPPAGPLTAEQAENALVLQKELKAMLPNATGATRDAISDAIDNLSVRGIDGYEGVASGRVDQNGNPMMTTTKVPRTERYDPATARAARAAGDGWTDDEIAKGTRIRYDEVTRPETIGDVASQRARNVEYPHPENR